MKVGQVISLFVPSVEAEKLRKPKNLNAEEFRTIFGLRILLQLQGICICQGGTGYIPFNYFTR
ncbi:hypothetical protein D3C80_2142750 [compost metagenome]